MLNSRLNLKTSASILGIHTLSRHSVGPTDKKKNIRLDSKAKTMNVSINYPVAVVMGRHNSDFFFGYWSKLLFLKVLPKLRKTIAYSEEDPLQEGEGDKKT